MEKGSFRYGMGTGIFLVGIADMVMVSFWFGLVMLVAGLSVTGITAISNGRKRLTSRGVKL